MENKQIRNILQIFRRVDLETNKLLKNMSRLNQEKV